MDDVSERLAAVEERLAALEHAATTPRGSEIRVGDSELWLVEESRRRDPEGAIHYGGHVEVAAGPVHWQYGHTAEDLLARDWSLVADGLSALAHPVRLHLLQLVLSGTDTTAALVADDAVGTTGQVHHHLRALAAAGWVVSVGRGRWAVPPTRVVPVLTLMSVLHTP